MRKLVTVLALSVSLFAHMDIDEMQNRAIAKMILKIKELEKKIQYLRAQLHQAESATTYYVVRAQRANVREEPRVDSPLMRKVRGGTLVIVDGFTGNWAHLEDGGYIHKSLLLPVIYTIDKQ